MNSSTGKRIMVITGGVREGKSTYAGTLVSRLREEGRDPGGFLSLSSGDNKGTHGYFIQDIISGETMELTGPGPGEDFISVGKFRLRSKAFEFGQGLIAQSLLKGRDPVFIDEVGILETRMKGWYESMQKLGNEESCIKIWVVRLSVLGWILKHWGISADRVFEVNTPIEQVLYKLKRL